MNLIVYKKKCVLGRRAAPNTMPQAGRPIGGAARDALARFNALVVFCPAAHAKSSSNTQIHNMIWFRKFGLSSLGVKATSVGHNIVFFSIPRFKRFFASFSFFEP
jgi:hypothetical protein